MRSRFVTGTIDVLAGLAALASFVLLDSFLHVAADLRKAVIILAFLSVSAGLARGSSPPANTWLKGLLVASGSSLALLGLLWNQIHRPILALWLLINVLFTVLGVHARRLRLRQSATKSAMIIFAPLIGLTILAVAAVPTLATRVATRRLYMPAPEFSIRSNDGAITAAALRGRVVVLDFWATWCPSCRREMPVMDKLYRHYMGDSRVSFWAVDVLNEAETVEKVRAFIAKNGYALPVAFIADNALKDLCVDAFPSLVILDKRGRIRLSHSGFDQSEPLRATLSDEIDALLREQ